MEQPKRMFCLTSTAGNWVGSFRSKEAKGKTRKEKWLNGMNELRELRKQRQTHTHTLKVLEGREKQGKETRSMCVLACECAREGKRWGGRRKGGVDVVFVWIYISLSVVHRQFKVLWNFFLFFFGGKNFGKWKWKWKWELLFCCHSHSLTHLTLHRCGSNFFFFLDLFCFC